MSTSFRTFRLVKALYPWRHKIARLTRLPLIGRIANRLFFSGDQVIYVPSSEHISIREPLQPESIVLPAQVVEHFIRRADSLFVMNTCICRSSNECKEYPIDLGCLFLGDAVHNINPDFGRLVSREEALAHIRRASRAGLVHTVGRSRIDSIVMGAGPSRKLLTICNCCPCCCLWNVLPDLHPRISGTIHRMPGLQVTVDGNCSGCGACTRGACFVNAIRLENGRAVISNECRGCGRCLEVCPSAAIRIQITDHGFVDEAIRKIERLVDLS